MPSGADEDHALTLPVLARQADRSLLTLRMSIRQYKKLPISVTAPLNFFSGGGRCEGESIAFIVASCRTEEIFCCCRAAGIKVPTEAQAEQNETIV
ncbi:MAG TPA: hypothetical protein HPP80_03605 [Rhodospirillaceae bacterium]|nr:hypothetical protein [Rhodospirillaceae bacterium]